MRTLRGFTIRELIAVIGVIVIVGCLALILVPRLRMEARRQKNQTQLRGVQQAMVTWRQSNNDDYPLPSRIDVYNNTVPESVAAKDTTSNIYSIMVFNRTIDPDILVSPLETSPHIAVMKNYEHSRPSGTVNPDKAMWDPKLSACLDGSKPGNISYAHLQPSGGRKARYHNSFDSAEPVISNRGPQISGVVLNPDSSVTPTFALPNSNTLRFFGRARAWSGAVAFNDNHVEFHQDFLASGSPVTAVNKAFPRIYESASGQKLPDLFCHDEPDDPKAANDYLGIFLKAGDTPKDFQAAWD
jgi:type II secretory pathway pseudopilin PulG